MNTVSFLVAVSPHVVFFLFFFFFFLVLVVVEGEWVGRVGDGVKAGGHSQTKGDTSAA